MQEPYVVIKPGKLSGRDGNRNDKEKNILDTSLAGREEMLKLPSEVLILFKLRT